MTAMAESFPRYENQTVLLTRGALGRSQTQDPIAVLRRAVSYLSPAPERHMKLYRAGSGGQIHQSSVCPALRRTSNRGYPVRTEEMALNNLGDVGTTFCKCTSPASLLLEIPGLRDRTTNFAIAALMSDLDMALRISTPSDQRIQAPGRGKAERHLACISAALEAGAQLFELQRALQRAQKIWDALHQAQQERDDMHMLSQILQGSAQSIAALRDVGGELRAIVDSVDDTIWAQISATGAALTPTDRQGICGAQARIGQAWDDSANALLNHTEWALEVLPPTAWSLWTFATGASSATTSIRWLSEELQRSVTDWDDMPIKDMPEQLLPRRADESVAQWLMRCAREGWCTTSVQLTRQHMERISQAGQAGMRAESVLWFASGGIHMHTDSSYDLSGAVLYLGEHHLSHNQQWGLSHGPHGLAEHLAAQGHLPALVLTQDGTRPVGSYPVFVRPSNLMDPSSARMVVELVSGNHQRPPEGNLKESRAALMDLVQAATTLT
jgi:hypothetical protein